MKTKIDKLAEKCWSHYINGTLIDGHLHFDYQKFAELIIKECVNIANNPAPGCHSSFGKIILEHFEIKD